MPVIVVAPHDDLFEKTVSNMQEVVARGGKVVLHHRPARQRARRMSTRSQRITLPHDARLRRRPIVYAMPVQLLAYHTAVAKGTDVDQPRNLAKSVTVE